MRQITKITSITCHIAPMIPGATQLNFNSNSHPEASFDLLQFGVLLRYKNHETAIPFSNIQFMKVESVEVDAKKAPFAVKAPKTGTNIVMEDA